MKKTFLALLALPMFLVACGEEKFDRNLNGTWEGSVQTTELNELRNISPTSVAITETIVFKFDDGSLTTYRAKNSNNAPQVEVEQGSYESDDNKIRFDIKQHSCVDAELDKQNGKQDATPSSRHMIYKLSEKQDQVTITMRAGMKVTLKRLEREDAENLDFMLSQSTTGCFIPGSSKFYKGKTKPKTLEVSEAELLDEEMTEMQNQVKKELGEVTPSEQ